MRKEITGLANFSWLPYKLFCRIREQDKSRVDVDLSDYHIDRRFSLALPDGDCGLSNQLRVFGFREPLNCRCYSEFISKDDILLDIGSNVGFFVLLGSHAKRIVCIEPLSSLIGLLEFNIEMNGLSDKCEVLNAAVGPKGRLLLEVNPQLNLSKIVNVKNERTVEVDSIPLGDLTEKYGSNAIRLDVEGFEHSLLLGQIPDSVNKISMEFHTGLMGHAKSRSLLKYLADEEFHLKYLVEDVPLRLYPFVYLSKSTLVSSFMTYVKADLKIEDAVEYVLSGRSLKYLFLVRNKIT